MSSVPSASELRLLPMDQIDPNSGNPRLIFPQEELDKLIESISQEGVLVPIVVYPRGDRFVLVDGERRFRSALVLGLSDIPALITGERTEQELLVQMFNIHLIREPWRDLPTAKALGRLIGELEATGADRSDRTLHTMTGLSNERIKQLKFALDLPVAWQDHIESGSIPLNWFWELDKNVVRPMRAERPHLAEELGIETIQAAFVDKRLAGVTGTDTVSLRKIRPIISFAAADASQAGTEGSRLDQILRSLVTDSQFTIEEAYEDTVQITVETDKLARRTETMVANFERLLAKAKSADERDYITRIGRQLIEQLSEVIS